MTIAPDDPRHGTSAGHSAGCRKPCCAAAKLRYDKLRQHEASMGLPRTVPVIGTWRRIRALQALGYSMPEIARHAGMSARSVANPTFRGDTIYRETAERIAAAYDKLCMTVPQGCYADRNRRLAQRRGWAPPLAWDNIDDPTEKPTGSRKGADHKRRDEVDEATVLRVLAGEFDLHTSIAERREIMRRWLASGRSEKSLCDAMGWHDGRYTPTSMERAS